MFTGRNDRPGSPTDYLASHEVWHSEVMHRWPCAETAAEYASMRRESISFGRVTAKQRCKHTASISVPCKKATVTPSESHATRAENVAYVKAINNNASSFSRAFRRHLNIDRVHKPLISVIINTVIFAICVYYARSSCFRWSEVATMKNKFI